MDVVLIDPQIPQNTGSIARTCAATQTPLCLVGNVGFDLSEKAVRRAGLDYWPWVPLHRFATWQEYLEQRRPPKVWLYSKFGTKKYFDVNYSSSDALVFGSESQGLGQHFMGNFESDQILRIPIACDAVRSLNLSNAVSVVVYEARRQLKLD